MPQGLIVFAAVMMMMAGGFHVIVGLVELFEDEFYVVPADYRCGSTRRTGALHLIDRLSGATGSTPRAGLDHVAWRGDRPRWDPDSVTERDQVMAWVRSVLRDAEVAVHHGDAGPRRAIWSRNDPVTV